MMLEFQFDAGVRCVLSEKEFGATSDLETQKLFLHWRDLENLRN
jgi:hypothetical protein